MPEEHARHRAGATPARLLASSVVRTRSQPVSWSPTRPEFTMFMRHEITCPACRMARQAAGLDVSIRLHVRRSGDLLTITEANDLHRPGCSLVATQLSEFRSVGLYRLVDQTPAGACWDRFLPATGIVRIARTGGRRRLRVLGMAKGLVAHRDVIFDAAAEACC